MPAITVLIKPASGLCNLACRYCFYNDVTDHREIKNYGVMSARTAHTVIDRAFEAATGPCTFAFQGGEPTIAGLDYFRDFCDYVDKVNTRGLPVNYSIQSNGTLMDAEWAQFLAQRKFLVGLSLDGPSAMHNAVRVDREGKGTFSKVNGTAQLLRRYGVEFNILSVVTDQLARNGVKVYEFFKKQGFRYIQFIPCLPPFDGPDEYGLTPQRYAKFLKDVFDAWFRDFVAGQYVSIRYIDNYIWILAGRQPEACSMAGHCSCQFVIEADGSVYPCDFYVLDQWKLGTVQENTLAEMFECQTARDFISPSFDRPQCHACRWGFLCRGGCRRDHIPAGEGRTVNRYCESYKEFLDYAYPRMRQVADLQRRMR